MLFDSLLKIYDIEQIIIQFMGTQERFYLGTILNKNYFKFFTPVNNNVMDTLNAKMNDILNANMKDSFFRELKSFNFLHLKKFEFNSYFNTYCSYRKLIYLQRTFDPIDKRHKEYELYSDDDAEGLRSAFKKFINSCVPYFIANFIILEVEKSSESEMEKTFINMIEEKMIRFRLIPLPYLDDILHGITSVNLNKFCTKCLKFGHSCVNQEIDQTNQIDQNYEAVIKQNKKQEFYRFISKEEEKVSLTFQYMIKKRREDEINYLREDKINYIEFGVGFKGNESFLPFDPKFPEKEPFRPFHPKFPTYLENILPFDPTFPTYQVFEKSLHVIKSPFSGFFNFKIFPYINSLNDI
jgi:hypothetical protein